MNLLLESASPGKYVSQLEKLIEQQRAEIYRLKNIIDNLPGSIYWKDRDGTYLGRNAYSHKKSKSIHIEDESSSLDSPIGKTDYDYFPKEVADAYRKHDIEVMEYGREFVREEIAQSLSGEKLIQLSSKRPLYDETGNIVGIVGNTVDITYLKEIETKLREAKEKLEEMNKGISLLSASIAHELRTPVASIKLGLEGLKKYFPQLLHAYQLAKSKELAVSNIAASNIEIMEQLLNNNIKEAELSHIIIDMLLMNIKEPECYEDFYQICSIAECINIALKRYPLSSEEKELINYSGEDFKFNGDQLLVIHIFFNLLKNALYYIKAANKGKIIIKSHQSARENYVYFKDTGAGIASNILPKIFNRYYSDRTGGGGIGLSYCKMVMQQLGGDICCHSVKNEYTEFVLSFPVINN